jgi:hypothetical protein
MWVPPTPHNPVGLHYVLQGYLFVSFFLLPLMKKMEEGWNQERSYSTDWVLKENGRKQTKMENCITN